MSSLLDTTVQISHEELIKDGWRHTWLCTETQTTAIEVYIKRVLYDMSWGAISEHIIYNPKTNKVKIHGFEGEGIEVDSIYELQESLKVLRSYGNNGHWRRVRSSDRSFIKR